MTMLAQEDVGRVRILRLMRPRQRNALSGELAQALEAALRQADRDPGVGAILLVGEGKSFCAGGDLVEFGALSALDPSQLYADGRLGLGLFGMQEELGTPLVAAVHGHVLAGGMGLLLLSHVAVAAEGTEFGLPEIELGLFPYTVLPLLARAVGARRALELALSGRRFGTEEAVSLGIVHDVVAAADVYAAALERARALSERDPLAVRTGLEAYRALAGEDMRHLLEHVGLLRNLAFGAPALRLAVDRFLAERGGASR